MTMLTVAEARAKARTRLKSSLAAWATGVVFTEPITTDPGETEPGPTSAAVEIALHPPTEKQVLADQEAAADWASSWRTIAPPAVGYGPAAAADRQTLNCPAIDWAERSWARVGKQQIPLRLRLHTPEVVANFVGGDEARQWRQLRRRSETLRSRFGDRDTVASAIRAHAKRIQGLSEDEFETLVDVTEWLREHPVGSMRPRQLPIRGVDSKWFETYRSLVTALLAAVGHPEAVDILGTERRARIRILDPELLPAGWGAGSLRDITAPVSQVSDLAIRPDFVFVFENLESVLAMPTWASAVAVHGSGYSVDIVARLRWIHDARVVYWGDLDSHGFAILARLRAHLPSVESVLMDEATLVGHEDLWVTESKPHTGTFAHLTGAEERALARIRAEGNVRLEQERIPWTTALAALSDSVRKATTASAGEPTNPDSWHG